MKSPLAELLAFAAVLVALLTTAALVAVLLFVAAVALEWNATGAQRPDAGSR